MLGTWMVMNHKLWKKSHNSEGNQLKRKKAAGMKIIKQYQQPKSVHQLYS